MLLIGVPALGYAIGAGAWIALRAVGLAVERARRRPATLRAQISLRMGYMLGRLFLLALAVILARRSGGQDDGLAALVVIVVAFTVQLAIIGRSTARGRRDEQHHEDPAVARRRLRRRADRAVDDLRLTAHKNNAFQIQNEFKLNNWVHLGVFSINRAVLYLFIASVLTSSRWCTSPGGCRRARTGCRPRSRRSTR